MHDVLQNINVNMGGKGNMSAVERHKKHVAKCHGMCQYM